MHVTMKFIKRVLSWIVLFSLFCLLFNRQSYATGTEEYWTRSNLGGGGWFDRVGIGYDGLVLTASDLSGAYRSLDGGLTWDIVGAKQGLTTTHVASFGFHPSDSTVFFLGTDNGIYRAIRRGDYVESVLSGGYIESIVIAANPENIGYAGWHSTWNRNDGQVFKTVDVGKSWQQVSGKLPNGLRILKILVSANDANVLYVLTGKGRFSKSPAKLYRSSDGGGSWKLIGNSIAGNIVDFALDKFDVDKIWLSVDDSKSNGHLYVITNSDNSLHYIASHGGAIWLDSNNPQTIRLFDPRHQFAWDSQQGIWESTNGGKNWLQVSQVSNWQNGWSNVDWSFTAPVYSVAVSRDNLDRLYWVNSQFIYASFDKGRTITQLYSNSEGKTWQSRGIDNVVLNTLTIAGNSDVWAGFYDLGLWRSQDGGKSWMNCNTAVYTGNWRGFGGDTLTLLSDPARPNIIWATQAGSPDKPARLIKSINPGDNCDQWTLTGKGLPKSPLYGLSLAPNSPINERVLYVTGRGYVYASRDDGRNWQRILKKHGFFVTAVGSDGTVFAGGEAGLWRSPISGGRGKWSEAGLAEMHGAVKGPPGAKWEGVYGIALTSLHPNWIYVAVTGVGKGLYLSKNYGQTWTLLLQDNFLRSVVVDPYNDNVLYATSSSALSEGGYSSDSHGVLRSVDGGVTWTQVNEGLAWNFALTIALDPLDTKHVFIGVPGAGIYQRTFASP